MNHLRFKNPSKFFNSPKLLSRAIKTLSQQQQSSSSSFSSHEIAASGSKRKGSAVLQCSGGRCPFLGSKAIHSRDLSSTPAYRKEILTTKNRCTEWDVSGIYRSPFLSLSGPFTWRTTCQLWQLHAFESPRTSMNKTSARIPSFCSTAGAAYLKIIVKTLSFAEKGIARGLNYCKHGAERARAREFYNETNFQRASSQPGRGGGRNTR